MGMVIEGQILKTLQAQNKILEELVAVQRRTNELLSAATPAIPGRRPS